MSEGEITINKSNLNFGLILAVVLVAVAFVAYRAGGQQAAPADPFAPAAPGKCSGGCGCGRRLLPIFPPRLNEGDLPPVGVQK